MAKHRTAGIQAKLIGRCLQLSGGYDYVAEYAISRMGGAN
jgi:hypothetical protein